MRALSAKATRRRSQRQENELAQTTGGKTQRGSGCLPWAKSDVVKVFEHFRAECKFTRSKSFSITKRLIDKLRGECDFHEVPIFDISFVSPEGRTDERWVCMPYESWVRQQQGKLP